MRQYEVPASAGVLPAVQSDYFSARYERTVNFAAGNYRFSATYDDGVRVYIDGQVIIDDWNLGSARTSTADRSLSGNHAMIEKWRQEQSIKRTQERRPDMTQGDDNK